MATLSIDYSSISAPLSGDNPAGPDLREFEGENDFRAVKFAREQARNAEKQAENEGQEPGAALTQWETVRELAERLLREQSKDLEVAAYLIEALVRLEGFAGLSAGFRVARELVENFWDGLYPLPDEDGVATRVLPLGRLNGDDGRGVLIAPMLRVPITQAGAVGPFSTGHYEQALDLEKLEGEKRERQIERGGVTLGAFNAAVRETDADFFVQLIEDLKDCLAEQKQLFDLLAERCYAAEVEPPPGSRIAEVLEKCLSTVTTISRDKLRAHPTQQAGSDSPTEGQDGTASGGGQTTVGGGQLRNRDDAFRVLLEVADFFERIEPQSLLPPQLRKVVKLAKLPPREYLQELIENSEVLDQLFKSVGIPKPAENTDSSY